MAYSFYHSVRLQGTKMDPLDAEDFVPKWETREEGETTEEDILLQDVPIQKAGLANKILSVFGLRKP